MLLQLLANIVKSLLLIVCLINCKGKACYDTIELKKIQSFNITILIDLQCLKFLVRHYNICNPVANSDLRWFLVLILLISESVI